MALKKLISSLDLYFIQTIIIHYFYMQLSFHSTYFFPFFNFWILFSNWGFYTIQVSGLGQLVRPFYPHRILSHALKSAKQYSKRRRTDVLINQTNDFQRIRLIMHKYVEHKYALIYLLHLHIEVLCSNSNYVGNSIINAIRFIIINDCTSP